MFVIQYRPPYSRTLVTIFEWGIRLFSKKLLELVLDHASYDIFNADFCSWRPTVYPSNTRMRSEIIETDWFPNLFNHQMSVAAVQVCYTQKINTI